MQNIINIIAIPEINIILFVLNVFFKFSLLYGCIVVLTKIYAITIKPTNPQNSKLDGFKAGNVK
ncbi:hypothetical protein D3C76_1507420 [compost metagenome]